MGRHWHRPGAFAIALTLAGLAAFLALGTWQVRRGHAKQRLFAAFDQVAGQPAMPLDQARRVAGEGSYQHVRVSGHFDPLPGWLLDNQMRDGRVGVMVYALFEPRDGSTPLLVNRGFLARASRDAELAIPALPAGPQTLDALYAPAPGAGLRLGGDALPGQSGWPKTTIYLDLAEIGADLGRSLDPRVLLLTARPGSPFVREWRPPVFPPERHFGYALTWYGFAALTLVLFGILHWRRDES